MGKKLSKIVWFVVAVCCIAAFADNVFGPDDEAKSPKHPPVYTAGVVQASPGGSPAPNGSVRGFRVDAYGNQWVKMLGTITATLSGNVTLNDGASVVVSNGNVTVGPSPINVFVKPSPVVLAAGGPAVNVTLPAASPLPIGNPTFSSLSTWATISVDTTVTGTQLVASNTARKLLILVNNGSTDVYVGFGSVTSGASASATGGLLLKSGGGSLTLDGPIVTSQVKAITASGSSVVFVGEGG